MTTMNLDREIRPFDVVWITVAGIGWFFAGLALLEFHGDIGLAAFVGACIVIAAYLLLGER